MHSHTSKRISNQDGLDDRDLLSHITRNPLAIKRDSTVFHKSVVIFETKILAESVKRGHGDNNKESDC